VLRQLGATAGDATGLTISRVRHRDALRKTSSALKTAAEGLERGLEPELVTVDLQDAIGALSELVGITTIEDVLDQLFSRFCIGK